MLTSILLISLSLNDLSTYSMILLQTSPRSIKAALSNCLREASSVEGVLECYQEHFWSIGKSLSQIVGTLKVRVTKNADEQLVLSQVHKIFSPLLSNLTIQVEKDDWNLNSISNDIPLIKIDIDNKDDISCTNTTTTNTNTNNTNIIDQSFRNRKIEDDKEKDLSFQNSSTTPTTTIPITSTTINIIQQNLDMNENEVSKKLE